MTATTSALIEAKTAEIALTTQYTSTGLKTIIDAFTATNQSTTAAASISVYLVAFGDTADSANRLVYTKTLQPYESYTFPEIVGHTLEVNDFIATDTSAATITIRSSGRKIT